MNRPKILITNDDGIKSPSVSALKSVFDKDYETCVVAPHEERSWSGKAISRETCVSLEELTCTDDEKTYSFTGTPADCVLLGYYHLCGEDVDLLISGINYGANVGNAFVLSSATVGAAIEGSFLGIPSISVSLLIHTSLVRKRRPLSEDTFAFGARFTKKIADYLIKKKTLPPNVDLLNINIPSRANEDSEVIITPIAKVHYGNIFREINKGSSESQRDFIFGKMAGLLKFELEENTDIHAAFVKRNIVISPISLQMTGDLNATRDFFKPLKL